MHINIIDYHEYMNLWIGETTYLDDGGVQIIKVGVIEVGLYTIP